MKQKLLAKKSIRSLAAQDSHTHLRRSLGAFDLTMMGVGAIIGAGLFVLTGSAAAHYTGPAVAISFALAAFICAFSALCYAELASLIPGAGSVYTYAYVTLGEFVAWILGWSLTLEYLLSASTVAGGWAAYLVSLLKDFGISISPSLSQPYMTYSPDLGLQLGHSGANLLSMLIIALMGFLISIGIKSAKLINNILVVIKIIVIALFVVCGIAYIHVDHWTPFIPENTGVFGQFGWSGILRGAGIVFFAFIGFDAISTLAQESRNPQKDMPKGMLGSLGISTLIYAIVALVLTGVVHYTNLGVTDPMAVAFNALGPKFAWLRPFVKIAILAGLTSVILVMLLGQARIFYSMSQDGLLPKIFSKTHPKFKTPVFTTAIVSLLAMTMSGLFPVEILGQLVSMGTLLGFAIVCLGVLVLRRTEPHLERPFKTPCCPWVPLLGIFTCTAQMALMPWTIWGQLLLWVVLGCVVYAFYGFKQSSVQSDSKGSNSLAKSSVS